MEEVIRKWMVNEIDAGRRLDIYLSEKLPKFSRTQFQRLILEKKVLIDGAAKKPHSKIQTKQTIEIHFSPPKRLELMPEEIPLDILYEDEDILVINKQPGLVVHPAPGHAQHTLVNAVLNHCKELAHSDNPLRPGIVHRLDKDTSGCLLVAKQEEGLRKLGMQFEKRKVMKQYLALVFGKMEGFKGEIELNIGRHPIDRKKMAVSMTGKPAHTTFEVVEKFKEATLVHVFLRTGRTHQIRVHMAHLGHPVLGDSEYGKRGKELSEKLGITRQMLHAEVIGITHPRTDEWMTFTAPVRNDMELGLKKLRIKD